MRQAPAPGNPRDTIFAVASGAGRAAISVIRLSGAETSRIVAQLAGKLPAPRRASLRSLRGPSGGLLDRALILWMPAPNSYTGEDTAELHLHGGRAVCAAVCGALLNAGARPADPGEFTRRAFLAGRMDLLEAEAVGDLAASETEAQRLLALCAIQGRAGQQVLDWAERLTRCLAFQEANIDFPDETAGELANSDAEISALLSDIEEHLVRAPAGERVRNGLKIAITGAPNVGKSSIFNALAGRDVAIVSPRPGTTRDALEAHLDLGGLAATLIDTAGLRETDDVIEAEGVARARAIASTADLVLQVTDATSIPALSASTRCVLVCNKIDRTPAPPGVLGVSAMTGEGLDELVVALEENARALAWSAAPAILSAPRHIAAMRDARAALQRAVEQTLPELRAEELRLALLSVGRLAGRVDTDAVLDVVFGSFCIGK